MGVHRIVLMRHAQATGSASSDRARGLTAVGRAEAAAAGCWLSRTGTLPTHVLVSAATRARQTWEGVASELAIEPQVQVDDSLYGAEEDGVLETIRSTPESAAVLMVVGHNPTVAALVSLLDDGEPDPEAFSGITSGFPTAAVAVFEYAGRWADLNQSTARLTAFHAGG